MNIKSEQLQDNWEVYTLTNNNGMTVEVLNYGGIITKIVVPDKNGQLQNVVLGYQSYKDYKDDANYFGALIGRVAGRIQNASFHLNGEMYTLKANEGDNHIHGGENGFHKVIWNVEPFQEQHAVGLKLTYHSQERENGYPGNLAISVTYTLTNSNQLMIEYHATTDKTTVLTLTNHSYFNLSGDLSNTIHNHIVTINSSQVVELDEILIPTGKTLDVTNSTFDFRSSRPLSDGIKSDNVQHKLAGNGYDHYFIFDNHENEAVMVKEPTSGRILTIETNQPGMVMYTANNLTDNLILREGLSRKYFGVCFETQGSPASLHHDSFPSIVLNNDETYHQKTVFTFDTEG